MQYLFLTFAALALAAFAPLKFTVALFATLLIIALVVKFTASKMIGPVSIVDAGRSVAWAFALLGGAIMAMLWMTQGQLEVEGFAALAVIAGLFTAFVFGFKIALGASFGASAAIALVSTIASSCLLFVLKPVLFS